MYKMLLFLVLCGYFDLIIDSSNVSVGFRYTVTAANANTSDIADIKIVGYSFPGSVDYITYLSGSTNTVQSSVAGNVNSSTIRIYVSWNDDSATQTLNDVQDTAIALNSGSAVVSVSVLFEQLQN